MIQFETGVNPKIIELGAVPILDIGRIVFATSDKEWVNRLFKATLTITFECGQDKNKIKYSSTSPLAFSTYITLYHKQPVMDINRRYAYLDQSNQPSINDCNSWIAKLSINNLEFKDGETLNIHLIETINQNQILNKLKTYLFQKIDVYSSYELVRLKIKNSLVLNRITFTEEFIQEKIHYNSNFQFEDYNVNCEVIKDQLRNLLPYTIKSEQYTIDLSKLNELISPFNESILFKEEEFGSKNDGMLYYLNRDLKRSASILVYNSGIKETIVYPLPLLEKIDSVFKINLKYVDLKSPLLCFVFKKTQLSLSTSQIFSEKDKENLRIFLDIDRYLGNIKDLSGAVKFKVDLFNQSKAKFFSKEFSLSEIIRENFIPPFFEILNDTDEKIFSSSVEILVNGELYDKMEGAYIRSIKLNVDIKS